MFGTAAACRDRIRLQPCEPKPRRAEARKYSLRWLRHENNTAPTEAELANLQRTLFLNEANAACGVASPATTKVTIHRAGRLRLAQHCELQNRQKLTVKQPHANNFTLYNPPAPLRRQRTAESTCTTLTKALTLVTPGGVADRPDAPGHLRGSKRKPLPEIDRAAVFGFCLRPNSQSALISCSTLLVLRTASAEAANLAASSFVRSIFTIFSIPLRPMIAGTPMQMSSWPYSPSR